MERKMISLTLKNVICFQSNKDECHKKSIGHNIRIIPICWNELAVS